MIYYPIVLSPLQNHLNGTLGQWDKKDEFSILFLYSFFFLPKYHYLCSHYYKTHT